MTPATETAHAIPARFDTLFEHTYPVEHPELRRLYENAKRDQWNVSRDIDWTTPSISRRASSRTSSSTSTAPRTGTG